MPEVKGNYIQFPKQHVVWLYQLKSQWLKWKMELWVHTGHVPPTQPGNTKQQSHAAPTWFRGTQNKTMGWRGEKKVPMLSI